MADQNMLWPVPHNWRDNWGESYEFQTEVITSRDQGEQRIANRALPRVRYRVRSTLRRDASPVAISRLAARQAQQFVLPHARLSTTLTAPILTGTTAFTLGSAPGWSAVGFDLVFFRPDGTTEWGRIASGGGAAGDLVDPVLADIPAGSVVRHGILGRFQRGSDLRLSTINASEAQLDFLAEPGFVYRIPPGAAAETYKARPLWTVGPNWAKPPELGFEQFQDVVDFGAGRRHYFDPVDYVSRRINATYLVKDQTTHDELYGHFIRQQGQQKVFYMPTWSREFGIVGVSTTHLLVAGAEVLSMFAIDPSHRNLYLRLKDGTGVTVEVSSISASGPDSLIEFVAPIAALVVSDIAYATWLLPVRFATDRVEFNWVTRDVVQVVFPVVSVRDQQFFGA